MDWSDILGFGLNAASGGLLGLIGSFVKVGASFLQEKQKLRELEVKNKHELDLYDKQIVLKGAERESEAQIADAQARMESYSVFTETKNVYKWVASVLSLTRVALTLGLWGLTGYLFFIIVNTGGIPYVDSAVMIKEIVNGVVFCAATATTWWFGDRPPQKRS